MRRILAASFGILVGASPAMSAPAEAVPSLTIASPAKTNSALLPQNRIDAPPSFAVRAPVLVSFWHADTANSKQTQTLLPADAQVTVLDWITDERKGKLVRLGVDIQDISADAYPSDIVVLASDFERMPLGELNQLTKQEEALASIIEGETYDEALPDALAVRSKYSRSRKKRRGMTYCYRYVKQHLIKEGLVDRYLPGGSAYMALRELPKAGFKRLNVTRPSEAEDGAVCVYDRDKRNRNGHIEVKKNDECYWYGYGCKAKSMYGRRQFVDCYAKAANSWSWF